MTTVPPLHRWAANGRLALPEVTLVAVSSLAINATLRALRLCMARVDFGAVRFLTDADPDPSQLIGIEHIKIDPITSRDAYSYFMLKGLADHVRTPFALCVQWDGYIVNAAAWRDAFLDVDYIGAPWPQFADAHTVGNGGFSLRSQRLLRACRDLRVLPDAAEDIVICRRARLLLEREYGVIFADEDLARQFAYERMCRTGEEFGFHGVFNMKNHLSASEFRLLYAALERKLHGRRETRDLMCHALVSGDVKLLLAAGKNWLALRSGARADRRLIDEG